MAQEAKFKLINYKLRGTLTEYLVRLHDADGEVVDYHITDYYNKDINEITSTRIWELSNRIGLERIEKDSRLGIGSHHISNAGLISVNPGTNNYYLISFPKN